MKQFAVVILAALLCSCGSTLKIKIDVMNREALRKQPGMIKLEVEQQYTRIKPLIDAESFNKYRASLKEVVDKRMDSLVTVGVLDAASKPGIIDAIDKYIDTNIQDVINKNNDGIKAYEEANASTDVKEIQKQLVLAKQSFGVAANTFDKMKDGIEHEIASRLSDPNTALVGLNQQVESAAPEYKISDDNIMNDVLTSTVVHAPNRFWKKYGVESDFTKVDYKRKYKKAPYSKTLVRTFMGNSDIAITMENKGHFTVKGVRVDAAKVVEATFKGLTQSIHFLAMTSGIPVGTATSAEDTPKAVVPGVSAVDKAKTDLDIQNRLFNESALNLVDAILLQQRNLVSTNAVQKKAAVNVVKSQFTAHKDQFKKTQP
jgi:hypothetical protein